MKIKIIKNSECGPGFSLVMVNRKLNFFLCHRLPERSFLFYHNKPILCARCTGILAGLIVGLGMILFSLPLTIYSGLLLSIPLIIDGTMQFLSPYDSTNVRRFITGILFGIGSIWVISGLS